MAVNEFIPVAPDPPKPPLPRPDRDKPSVQHDIATPDKIARTGSAEEKVRNAPPERAWSDIHK